MYKAEKKMSEENAFIFSFYYIFDLTTIRSNCLDIYIFY